MRERQSNRWRYLLTPTGIAEKTRLTYEFMDYSPQLYSQVRQHLRTVLGPAVRKPQARRALRHGEAAELAYLSVAELGLELVAVFGVPTADAFLAIRCARLKVIAMSPTILLLVATLERSELIVEELVRAGVRREPVGHAASMS